MTATTEPRGVGEPTEAHRTEGALGRLESILKSDDGRDEMSLGALFDRMEERAFGLFLLVLALPCCLPFVYILPQVVALPMVFLAAQMAVGRQAPWLPEKLRNRTFSRTAMLNVLDRAKTYLKPIEAIAHPRLTALSSDGGSRFVGALLIVPCLSILLPLPLTNTVPGAGVALASLGLVERDGLLILAGLVLGLGWVLLLISGSSAAVAALAAIFGSG